MDDVGKLEPCPFCGADDADALRVMARTYRAGCRSCGAHVLGDTMVEAYAAWNRRSSPPPSRGVGREEAEGLSERLSAEINRAIDHLLSVPDATAETMAVIYCLGTVGREASLSLLALEREERGSSRDHAPTTGFALDGWRDIASAPENERLLVDFQGAGPIVAYRDPEHPYQWVRYLGYGKSRLWPTVHEDYALRWRPLPANSPSEASASAEAPDEPIPTAGDAQRKSEWRCAMCEAPTLMYADCCTNCELPNTVLGCVRAIYDEYMKDECCDYTAINRLIERASELADPAGTWDEAAPPPPEAGEA